KSYNLVGEIITFTKNSIVKSDKLDAHFKAAIEKFTKDKAHCKVIKDSRFKDIGVGYYKTKKGYYWVVTFGEDEPKKRR
ncbi:MAG: CAP domain-containing protein, partial [Epsilonproteobacteria bacterium]|nr:CAP domain-containing protein [Campylobacterota bacterium]